MLKRFRIEVEEQSIAETVEALSKYEHALQCAEAGRYDAQWPVELVSGPGEPLEAGPSKEAFTYWDKPRDEREWFDEELGREVTDEVVELIEPGLYKGRRVVQFTRIDTRRDDIQFIKPQVGYFEFDISGPNVTTTPTQNSGTNP